jgi:hypothetical protein
VRHSGRRTTFADPGAKVPNPLLVGVDDMNYECAHSYSNATGNIQQTVQEVVEPPLEMRVSIQRIEDAPRKG